MPSKLRKALGAMKDQTSIGLAKVSPNNFSNLDITVLKATTHEEVPIEERYVSEVLILTSSSKNYAAACAQVIGKRIGRTRNWIVALKSLMLVLRIFQDGGPYFPQEVIDAMKRGAKILNLSGFRDDSNSSPWDYTAFIRTFALYLNERLDCYLSGKLQRRASAAYRDRDPCHRVRHDNEPVRDMNPPMLLDRISYWQRLLDRTLATRPTGEAKTNQLVQIALYLVVQESFDIYRDISDGLALLLDSFFHLQYQSCVDAFQTCIRASKQFEELCGFYTVCKNIGVGRMSEYPSVQKISDELIETLQEFLKDKSSFPGASGRTHRSQLLLLPAPSNTMDTTTSSEPREASERSETSEQLEGMSSERYSDMGSEQYDQRTSIGDLISVTDAGTSPSVFSVDQEQYLEQLEKQPQLEESINGDETISSNVVSVDQGSINSVMDLAFIDDRPLQQEQEQLQQPSVLELVEDTREGWELVLAETASNMSLTQVKSNIAGSGGFEPSLLNSLYDQASQNHNNPFLQETSEMATPPASPTTALMVVPVSDPCSLIVTLPTTPTFFAQNPINTSTTKPIEKDPFEPYTPIAAVADQMLDESTNQQHLLYQQQLWLHNQNKIIEKQL